MGIADNELQFPSVRIAKAQGTVFCNRYFDTPSQPMICYSNLLCKKRNGQLNFSG